MVQYHTLGGPRMGGGTLEHLSVRCERSERVLSLGCCVHSSLPACLLLGCCVLELVSHLVSALVSLTVGFFLMLPYLFFQVPCARPCTSLPEHLVPPGLPPWACPRPCLPACLQSCLPSCRLPAGLGRCAMRACLYLVFDLIL